MEETLGKRIVQHRKQLGLTQEQLAERLGVTAQAVSKWENDQSCPDITMLPMLAEIFGTTTDCLLGRDTARVCDTEVIDSVPEEDMNRESGFEFQWDGGRKYTLGFAVLVLTVGILWLLVSVLDWTATFWDIFWPTAMLVFGLLGIYPRFSFVRLGCTLFGAYFLLDNLGVIPFAVGADVILPSLVVLFGLSLLADALKKPARQSIKLKRKGNKTRKDYTINGERFTFDASFGESTQFVDLPRLAGGEASISFGDYTIDLSGVNSVSDNCSIDLNCNFGELTLLVPRCYQVRSNGHTAFAEIHTDDQPNAEPKGIIYVEASANFGEIHIKYV